jgi:peptide/nickel transport system substrate-binding protein
MKKGAIWIALTFLISASLVLASCSSSTTTAATTTSAASTTTASTTTTAKTSTTTSAATTTTTAAVTATTTSTGNWWDSMGTPQYGGTLTLQTSTDITTFDPYDGEAFNQIFTGYMEQLFMSNWTVNPSVQNYRFSFWSDSQAEGGLLSSWEFTGPGTLVLHLRQGVTWQNIAPSNGRAFTSADVVYHFDRMIGLGGGFTTAAAYWGSVANWKLLTSVTANDKYTVTMQWSTPNPEFITEVLEAPDSAQTIEDSDAVTAYSGSLDNWHSAIGTGPFILSDFVSGSAATLVKNPNYWGYDERFPQNKLPYVSEIVELIIPNQSTALAALRVGKITAIDAISAQQAAAMQQTNPSIMQLAIPIGTCQTIDPRNDKAPYNDLRVREALQMAINLPLIAQTYYNGQSVSTPEPLTSDFMTGWGAPYSTWPADLQAQYAYNPTQAKALLAAAGYANGFTTDIVANQAADMGLLQIVQSMFSSVNVTMSIQVMTSAAFSSYVLTNHSNDALDIRAPSQGDLGLTFYPLRQLTKFQTGGSSNDAVVNDPTFNNFYTQALAATSTSQVQSIVTAANLYVAQQHFVISLLQPYQYALYQPNLVGLNDQYGSISGASGPLLLFEYGARFWLRSGQ